MVDKDPLEGNELAKLWIGKCTVWELGSGTDPKTGISWFEPVQTIENEPCRLSYSTPSPAVRSDSVTTADLNVTLFIRPDLIIPAGSKIRVEQRGRTVDYYASGQARVYSQHQEILLALWDNKV